MFPFVLVSSFSFTQWLSSYAQENYYSFMNWTGLVPSHWWGWTVKDIDTCFINSLLSQAARMHVAVETLVQSLISSIQRLLVSFIHKWKTTSVSKYRNLDISKCITAKTRRYPQSRSGMTPAYQPGYKFRCLNAAHSHLWRCDTTICNEELVDSFIQMASGYKMDSSNLIHV